MQRTEASTTSLKVNGKPIKKYYVRVRTYKKVGKTNYYSSWSKASSVTTKTGLSLNAYKITLFNGEGYKLKCTGTDKKITWQTSDPTVAVVNRLRSVHHYGQNRRRPDQLQSNSAGVLPGELQCTGLWCVL